MSLTAQTPSSHIISPCFSPPFRRAFYIINVGLTGAQSHQKTAGTLVCLGVEIRINTAIGYYRYPIEIFILARYGRIVYRCIISCSYPFSYLQWTAAGPSRTQSYIARVFKTDRNDIEINKRNERRKKLRPAAFISIAQNTSVPTEESTVLASLFP